VLLVPGTDRHYLYCTHVVSCALRAVASVGLVVAFSIVEFVAKKALDYMEIE
jgi:hypothetical protein